MEVLATFSTIIIMMFEPANAAVGYVCGSDFQKVSAISLLDIDKCETDVHGVKMTNTEIAILNINDLKHTDIIQCRVQVRSTIKHCGIPSHNSAVKDEFSEYTYPVTREMCETALNSGTMTIDDITIDGLPVNKETTKPITSIGSIDSTGSCNGKHYRDPFGIWDNVFVNRTVTVLLKKESVEVKINSDKIILPSRYQCKFSVGECVEFIGGYSFWHALPRTNCNTETYSTLFRGRASRFASKEETVYSVNMNDTNFALSIVGSENSCGVTVFKTEHPHLFIVEREDYELLHGDGITNSPSDDSEIFRFLNNKFMFVETFRKSQINSFYANFKTFKCRLNSERFKNSLLFADTQPDQFAYQYMQSRGYMAVMTGEVVHIVTCLPVLVKFRHSNKCYNRLPIEIGDQSLFLTPVTHIITKYATELPCDTPLYQHFKIDGNWYVLTPEPTPVGPQVYQNPRKIDGIMIYPKQKLIKKIMRPLDQVVIQQIMSQQVTNNITGSVSFENIFDEILLEKLAENFWSRTWGMFVGVGTIGAGLMGIFVIVIIVITIIDICINGYALYSVYGWSFQVLAALCSSMAMIMLSRGNHRKSQGKPN